MTAIFVVTCLFAAAPAQAQTTIWSATLTADFDIQAYGCSNDRSTFRLDRCSSTTVLTDDDFTYSGTDYTIRTFYWNSTTNFIFLGLNGLSASATKTALSGLTLNVDGTALAVSNASFHGTTIALSYDPATDWADGTTVSLSLTPPPLTAASFRLSGRENGLHVEIADQWGATGYDVHYTSAPLKTPPGEGEVAHEAAASGSDPASGWVAVQRSGAAPEQTISGLVNGRRYEVRVRAKNSSGDGQWGFNRHKAGAEVIRLTPDSTLLTGLTINDGTRDLKIQPNLADAVGLGKPGDYAVHVHPDVKSLSLTPTWTNTSINGVTYDTYDANRPGSDIVARGGWGISENGTAMAVPLTDGVTLIALNMSGAVGRYTVYVYHTSEWETVDARLKRLEMLTN